MYCGYIVSGIDKYSKFGQLSKALLGIFWIPVWIVKFNKLTNWLYFKNSGEKLPFVI